MLDDTKFAKAQRRRAKLAKRFRARAGSKQCVEEVETRTKRQRKQDRAAHYTHH